MVLLIVVTASKTDFMLLHTMCIKMHSYSMVFNKPAIEYWPDRCRERGHSDAQLCTVSGHYVICACRLYKRSCSRHSARGILCLCRGESQSGTGSMWVPALRTPKEIKCVVIIWVKP